MPADQEDQELRREFEKFQRKHERHGIVVGIITLLLVVLILVYGVAVMHVADRAVDYVKSKVLKDKH